MDTSKKKEDPHWILHGYHMDSLSHSGNIHCAQAIADQFQRLIYTVMINISNSTTTTTQIPPSSVNIQTINVPQQQNGYDCGIHVLLNAETVLQAMYHTTTIVSDSVTTVTTTTSPISWMRMRMNDNHYFQQHQQHRWNQPDFSMIERQTIAQDMIQQYYSMQKNCSGR